MASKYRSTPEQEVQDYLSQVREGKAGQNPADQTLARSTSNPLAQRQGMRAMADRTSDNLANIEDAQREQEQASKQAERDAVKAAKEQDRAAEAARARDVRAAAAAGAKTVTDIETGKRSIATHPDGAPVSVAGPVGEPFVQPTAEAAFSSIPGMGSIAQLARPADKQTLDQTTEVAQKYRNDKFQEVIQPLESKTDPKTGEIYNEIKNEFGAPQKVTLGADQSIVAEKEQKAAFEQRRQEFALRKNQNDQASAAFEPQWQPVKAEYLKAKSELETLPSPLVRRGSAWVHIDERTGKETMATPAEVEYQKKRREEAQARFDRAKANYDKLAGQHEVLTKNANQLEQERLKLMEEKIRSDAGMPSTEQATQATRPTRDQSKKSTNSQSESAPADNGSSPFTSKLAEMDIESARIQHDLSTGAITPADADTKTKILAELKGQTIEQAKADASARLDAQGRSIAARYIGTGVRSQELTGKKPGKYAGIKNEITEMGAFLTGGENLQELNAQVYRLSGGDLDIAIEMAGKMGESPLYSDETAASVKKQLEGMKAAFDEAGIKPEDRRRMIEDAAKSQAWTENDADLTRQLSTGDIVINPSQIFGQKNAIAAEIDGSGASDKAKKSAHNRLEQMRQKMGNRLFTDTVYSDAAFKDFAHQQYAAGNRDNVDILDKWAAQQKDRNWIFKAADAITEGIKTGSVGIDKTIVGALAGVGALVGADGISKTFGEASYEMGNLIQSEQEAAKLRGMTGTYGIASDLTDTVAQMAPMIAGGTIAGGLKGLSAAVTQGMSAYGWAGAQGYESKLSDAVSMAETQKGAKLTPAEISGVLGRTDTQVAAFLNGAQTALLAAAMPKGSERIALGTKTASMTVSDFLRSGGMRAIKDGTLRKELNAMGKTIFADAKDEMFEEFSNQVLDGMISVATLGKDMNLGDLLEESFKAGALGGIVGGAMPQTMRGKTKADQHNEMLLSLQNQIVSGPDGQMVNTAIAAIDPQQKAPDQKEIQSAMQLVAPKMDAIKSIDKLRQDHAAAMTAKDYTTAAKIDEEINQIFTDEHANSAKDIADAVILNRELSDLEDQAANEIWQATQDFNAARASGDKQAIAQAEVALEQTRQNAPNVPLARAGVKLGTGKNIGSLTDAELRSIGYKPGEDGQVVPMTPKELADNGLTKPLIRRAADGTAVILDEAVNQIMRTSPLAANRIQLGEQAAMEAAQQRFDAAKATQPQPTATNGQDVQGQPGTQAAPQDAQPAPANPVAPGGSVQPAAGPAGNAGGTGTPKTQIADSASSTLAPRADSSVEPRPERQGRNRSARDAWDETYGQDRKGGRTHNDDGTPYQPTVFDEVAPQVMAARNKMTDEEAVLAIGDSAEASIATSIKRLLNAGWTWDAKKNRMVNPANPNERPIDFLSGKHEKSKEPSPEAVASYAASDAAIYTAARQANPALPSISDVVTAAKAAGQPVSPSMEQAAAQEAQSQPAQPQEQSAPSEQRAASPPKPRKALGIAERIKSRVEAAIPGLKGRVNVIEKTSRPSGGAIANDDGTVSLVLSDIEAQLGAFDEQAVEDSVSAMVSEHEVTHVVQYQAVRKAWEDAGGAEVGPFGSFWKEWYGKIHSELSPEAIAAAADIYNGNTAKPWMEMTEKERAASQWGRIPNDANKAAELVRMLVEASRPGADKGRFSELMRALSLKQSPTLIETIRRAVEILVDMVKTGKLPVAVREHVEAISALYDQLLAAEPAIPEISDDLADSRAVAMQAVRNAKENLPILKANDDLRIDLETVAWDLAEVMAGMPAEERKAFVDTTIREWLESNAASIEQVTEEAAAAKDEGKSPTAKEKAKAAREAYQARIRAKAREILNSGDFSVLSAIFDKGAITPKPNAIALILKRKKDGKKLTEKEMNILRPHKEGGHWDGMPRKQDYPGGGNNAIVRAIIDAIMAPQGKGQMPHEMATAINQKYIGKASEMWEAVYRELESISRGTSMIGEDPDAIETPENIAKAEAERATMPVTMGNVVDEARAEFGDDHPVTRKAMLFTRYADRLTPEMEDMLIKVMQAEAGRVRAGVVSPTAWQGMTSGWTDQFKAVHKAIASHTPESLEAWLKGLPVIEEEWQPMFSSAVVPPFYSQLSRALEDKMPKSAPIAQVVQIATSGAKAEEIKWSGLVQWLQSNAVDGKVSKDAVLEFLRNEGAVRFEEKTGATNRSYNDAGDYVGADFDPKFGQYVLPGGENYREVVLAMPIKQSGDPIQSFKKLSDGSFDVVFRDGEEGNYSTLDEARIDGGGTSEIKGVDEYRSSHFPDVPNYVAHMRTNERTDADGKQGLFVEEFQSDRHQAGRKQGYKTNELEAGFSVTEENGNFYIKADDDGRRLTQNFYSKEKAIEAFNRMREQVNSGKVADAPFRTTWPVALFKRALRDAVASGKDWIGWTVGETQNDRFDLSKQVRSITWNPYERRGSSTLVTIEPNNGNPIELPVTDAGMVIEGIGTQFDGKRLDDVVGKDIAEKILNEKRGNLSGDGLKVGGSGMKGFYDNMLPKEIGKYVKQWGAKVEKSTMPSEMDYKTWREQKRLPATRETLDQFNAEGSTAPIWRIDITPAMKAGVEAGQALFSSAPQGSFDFTQSLYTTKEQPGLEFNPIADRGTEIIESKVDAVVTPEVLPVNHPSRKIQMTAATMEEFRKLSQSGRLSLETYIAVSRNAARMIGDAIELENLSPEAVISTINSMPLGGFGRAVTLDVFIKKNQPEGYIAFYDFEHGNAMADATSVADYWSTKPSYGKLQDIVFVPESFRSEKNIRAMSEGHADAPFRVIWQMKKTNPYYVRMATRNEIKAIFGAQFIEAAMGHNKTEFLGQETWRRAYDAAVTELAKKYGSVEAAIQAGILRDNKSKPGQYQQLVKPTVFQKKVEPHTAKAREIGITLDQLWTAIRKGDAALVNRLAAIDSPGRREFVRRRLAMGPLDPSVKTSGTLFPMDITTHVPAKQKRERKTKPGVSAAQQMMFGDDADPDTELPIQLYSSSAWDTDSYKVWRFPDEQTITSAETSINSKTPAAGFKAVKWKSGTVNADIGGGKFNNATEMLAAAGVENVIFDPFNRTWSENKQAVSKIHDGQADTATVFNVLNVIREPEVRELVIRQAANSLKPGGQAYFQVYEGDKSGTGKKTPKGWQENRPLDTYMAEISRHFGQVRRFGQVISAEKPIRNDDVLEQAPIVQKQLIQGQLFSSQPGFDFGAPLDASTKDQAGFNFDIPAGPLAKFQENAQKAMDSAKTDKAKENIAARVAEKEGIPDAKPYIKAAIGGQAAFNFGTSAGFGTKGGQMGFDFSGKPMNTVPTSTKNEVRSSGQESTLTQKPANPPRTAIQWMFALRSGQYESSNEWAKAVPPELAAEIVDIAVEERNAIDRQLEPNTGGKASKRQIDLLNQRRPYQTVITALTFEHGEAIQKTRQSAIDATAQEAAFSPGDFVRIEGKGRVLQIESIGDDGWVYLTNGNGSFTPDQAREKLISAKEGDDIDPNAPQGNLASYVRPDPATVEEVAAENPAFVAPIPETDTLTPEQAASELAKRGITIEKDSTKTGKTVWRIMGKTFDVKDHLKAMGAKWFAPAKAWSIFSNEDPTQAIANTLAGKQPAAKPTTGGEPSATPAGDDTGTDGKPGEDLRLRQLRDRLDRSADERGTRSDAIEAVNASTADLIRRGLKYGMPPEVVEDQIEDIAMITRAFEAKKPMFLLGNGAGTGKTFVLGGAIRELRAAGASSFVYVTMNTDLIAQIKRDLADFGIQDVSFHTYSEMSGKSGVFLPDNAVLIFDEAHNVKNSDSSRGEKAQPMMARAKFTIFASATPFENPVEASYLAGTGVFNEAGGHTEWGKAYGANVRKYKVMTPYGMQERETLYWTGGKLEDGLAARQWFVRQGIMVTRPMRLPMEMVESQFTKRPVTPQYVEIHDRINAAYDEAMSAFRDEDGNILDARNNAMVSMHQTNTIKRVLEAAKIDHAVEEANRILDAGGNVVVFVETKADRFIGRYRASQFYDKSDRLYTYPEIRELMAEWQIMAGMARMSNEAKPPRPFAEFIVQIARAMHEAGIEYELPSVEEQIVEKLGGTSKVAIYTGSVSNAAASKDKEAFLAGKKRVIVATMAKGGTGLSLHDKVGNRETWQVNLNLPWRATGVDQVSGRVARYGLQSKAHINWLFADNIPFERMLAGRVGRRMRDMGALVKGIDMKAARVLTDEFDFQGTTDVKQREGEVSAPDMQDDIWALAERLEKSRSKASDTSMGFFETPYPLAALMTEVSGARGSLLEPSGGRGNLVRFVKDNPKVTSIQIIEARRDNADYLKGQYGDRVTQGDFLEEADSLGKFDTIHMNPPFERVAGIGAQDVAHVMKAFDLLEDNGRLVAIMGEGAFFRNYQQEREFRQWLDDRGAIVVKLPENAFKNSGTGVRTRMVILDKNGEAGRTDIDLEDMDTDSLQSVADAIPNRDSVQMFSSSPVGGQGFFDFGAESGFNTKSQLGFNFEGQPVAKPEPATPDFRLLPTEDKKAIVQEKTRETAERKAAGIQDFGEKIGGARKDLAGKSEGTKPKREISDKAGWFNRYEVAEVVAEKSNISALERYWMLSAGHRHNESEVGRFVINDKRKTDRWGNNRATKETFATREEAEAYIPIVEVSRNHRVRRETVDGKDQWGVWREISDRKRVQVVKQTFDTEREAMEFMVRNAVDIIETKTAWREELIVKPEKPVRKGPDRRDRPATPEMFQEAFGFRGVEFGNWMRQAGDGKERQEVLNHAYDGLLDMAEVLGVPPKALSLNGELGLAFGARGQGLSGAKAHYESDYVVINLTKMNGAGSLAHEWIHALDHYLGRLDGRASSKWVKNNAGHMMLEGGDPSTRMVSHRFSKDSEVRPELRDAFTRLMDTIFNKAVKFVEDSQKAENFVAYSRKELEGFLSRLRAEFIRQPNPQWEKRRKPATEAQLAVFDSIANKFISGEDLDTDWRAIAGGKAKWGNYRWTNDALETMGELYKQITNRTGFDKEGRGTIDQLRNHLKHYQTRIKMLESAAAGDEKTRKVPTEFSMNAKRIDQGSLSDYWNTPHEMLARAFSAYIEDRIGESGGTSDFLAYGSDNNLPFYRLFNLKPFPEGTERDAIDKAFDELFRTFKTRETEKGVQLYSSAPQQPDLFAAATAPDAADKLGDVKVGRMNALAAYRALTAKRNAGKTLDAKEEQQLLDAEQALGQKLAFDMEGVKGETPSITQSPDARALAMMNRKGFTREDEVIRKQIVARLKKAGADEDLIHDITVGKFLDMPKAEVAKPAATFGQNVRATQDEMMRTGEVDRSGQISLLSSAVTPEQDAYYLDAVEKGDMDTAQRLVHQASFYAMGDPNPFLREANGDRMKMYHGSGWSDHSVFSLEGTPHGGKIRPERVGRGIDKLGFWFTSSKSQGEAFSFVPGRGHGKTYSTYLNIKNPLVLRSIEEWNDWVERYAAFHGNDAEMELALERSGRSPAGWFNAEMVRERLRLGGKDGIVVLDSNLDGRFGLEEGEAFPTWAIALTSNQIKSADPVTYDANGKVIPLSQRFNPAQDSILYSSAVHWPTNLYAYDYRTEGLGGDVQHIVRAYNERTGLKEDRKFDTYAEAKAEMDRLDDLGSPALFSSIPNMPVPPPRTAFERTAKRLDALGRTKRTVRQEDAFDAFFAEELAKDEEYDKKLSEWVNAIPENKPISFIRDTGDGLPFYYTVTKNTTDAARPWRTTYFHTLRRPDWTDEEEIEYETLFKKTRWYSNSPEWQKWNDRLYELGSRETTTNNTRIVPSGHDESKTRMDAVKHAVSMAGNREPKIGSLFSSAPENDPFQLALSKMPPIYGEVFRAVEAGMSPENVAAKFNVTSKAVTNILNEVRSRAVIAAKAQAGTLKPETNADGKFVNGRPDLAEGANPDFVAIDQNRNESGIPDVVSMEENYAEADRRLAANYEGEFARLERMAASGQRPDRIDIALAKQIFRRETLSGGLVDPQRRARVALFRVAYREQGTEQGRAFQMRRDEALTPAERNALHFTELLYEPSPQVQERMKGADPETRDAILKKWMDQIDAFKAEMKADGIDIEASLAAWYAHKAAVEKAEQVHAGTKTAMDEAFMKLSPPEKMVIRLIRDKAKLSTVMRQTGMTQEQVMDVKHRFGMAWKQAIIDAGKKFAANSLASSAPEDIYDMVMSDLGWQSDEDFNDLAPDYFEKQDQKRKDAKTRERKRKELAAPKVPTLTPKQQEALDAAWERFQAAPPATWNTLFQTEEKNLAPLVGQTAFQQWKGELLKPWRDLWQTEMDAIADPAGRITFEQWIAKPRTAWTAKQTELFEKERLPINETRGTFDVNDPIVMAEVVNEWARRNGSWINKLTEFYKMAILSGPQTMLVNASGGLYVGYDLTVKRATEAAWNGLMGMFGAGDVRSATFSEFLPMLKQVRAAASLAARNAIESWKLQSPVFDSYASAKPIQLDFTGVGPEYAPPATTSAISRFLRNITFRELTAVDEFWKGMFAQMDVAALAHRIAAKEEGLSGKAYTDRVEQLMKRGSLAWQRSITRTKRATFQDQLAYGKWTAEDEKKNPAHKEGMPMTWRQALKKSETESAWTILDAIAAKAMEARKTPFFGPLLHVFALPFIATPKNMIQRGLEVTPLGLVVDLIDGMRSLRRRVMSGQITKEESNRIASELYNNTRFIQLLTNQTMGAMIYLAVESLTGGDDDDEYGRPVITGTLPFSATKKGERDTAQAVMPPQSIRIGETIIPYGRIEPFATALSAMVDLAASARRNEGYNAQVVTDSVVGMKEQFKDKLFLKGLGDILRVIENPERGADRLAAGWITGFIPNILRQPIRETDKTLRDTNPQADDGFITAVGKRIGYSVAPQFAPAKLDVWGNEIPSNRGELIGGSTLADSVFRIFDPFNVRTGGKIRPIDAWIFRYNASQPDSSQRIGIEPLGDEVTITVPGETKPRKIALTAQEHAEAIRRIGQAAQSFLGDDWDWKTATAPDAAQRADLIKDTFTTLKRQETERLKIEKTAAATK